VSDLATVVGRRCASRILDASRATSYRRARAAAPVEPLSPPRRASSRALTPSEVENVCAVLHQERFADRSVRSIYAVLLDEGEYLCSISTMYRMLSRIGETTERRRLATHPPRVKPELLATMPCQVWSWDITRLPATRKWTYFHLYMIVDVFSRYIVGWRVEAREDARLAEEFFADTFTAQGVETSQLTVHGDNGAAMTSKTLAQLFCDLAVTRSHSRPHVSNDNPFSESLFKTLKYGPTYPERFDTIEEARAWCARFVNWYNNEHRHTGIALLTPSDVHHGRVEQRRDARRAVLRQAWERRPDRFVRGRPEPPALEPTTYINRPELLKAA